MADRLTTEVQELIEINDEAADALTEAMVEQNSQAIQLISVCLAIAIGIGILLTVMLSRLIANPLLALVTTAQRVA